MFNALLRYLFESLFYKIEEIFKDYSSYLLLAILLPSLLIQSLEIFVANQEGSWAINYLNIYWW